jgi:hypothetical protein
MKGFTPPLMQLTPFYVENSTAIPPASVLKFKVKPVAYRAIASPAVAFRSGAFTKQMAQAEQLHQFTNKVKIELPGGYSFKDFINRSNTAANNLLRITQAWGWDFELFGKRIYQATQHKWETTTRDLGNNILNASLISLVKGSFLSNLLIEGLMQSAYTSKPKAYVQGETLWQRTQKVWHNTVRHPFRQAFGLSAHPLTTIGHVLPENQRHWLATKPLDTNIELIKRFGESLSLQTTFKAIQEAILATDNPSLLLDEVRKSGTRKELKQLYMSLTPEKTIKPQVMAVLATLFDEKTGALKKEAPELALKVEADLAYHLALYRTCGGAGASQDGIKKMLRQVLTTHPITVVSNEGAVVVKPVKEIAMAQVDQWFQTINAHWKKDADQAVRSSTCVILDALADLYNDEQQKALQAGKAVICKQTLAKRFADEVAPSLMSKTENTLNGKLAAILEPAFQLSQRIALLDEYESHRSMGLLLQTITQALFTCFVLGNLLFFVVFNTLARLDVDFKGPNGEARLDFGEMKRCFKRWIKKQLGQEEAEPQVKLITPKVSLDLSLGYSTLLRKEQQALSQYQLGANNQPIYTHTVDSVGGTA